MPTRKPRLSITLEDRHHDMLQRLSDVSGDSMGSIVVELVEAAMPILTQMVEAAERYRDLDADKQRALLEHFEADADRIMPQAEQLLTGVQQINQHTLDAFKRVADAE